MWSSLLTGDSSHSIAVLLIYLFKMFSLTLMTSGFHLLPSLLKGLTINPLIIIIIVLLIIISLIPAYSQLFWDYNYIIGSVEGKAVKCLCGSTNCRGRLI